MRGRGAHALSAAPGAGGAAATRGRRRSCADDGGRDGRVPDAGARRRHGRGHRPGVAVKPGDEVKGGDIVAVIDTESGRSRSSLLRLAYRQARGRRRRDRTRRHRARHASPGRCRGTGTGSAPAPPKPVPPGPPMRSPRQRRRRWHSSRRGGACRHGHRLRVAPWPGVPRSSWSRPLRGPRERAERRNHQGGRRARSSGDRDTGTCRTAAAATAASQATSGRDARGDRRAYGAFEARDPPLLPAARDRHGPGGRLVADGNLQPSANDRLLFAVLLERGGRAVAELPEMSGFWRRSVRPGDGSTSAWRSRCAAEG